MKSTDITQLFNSVTIDLDAATSGKSFPYKKRDVDFQQTRDTNPFLFSASRNRYKFLHEYIQTSEAFHAFRTHKDLMPIYWSLFALKDVNDPDQRIEYLYGPSVLKQAFQPSFIFRSYYESDGAFQDEDPGYVQKIGLIAQKIRHNNVDKAATQDLSNLKDEIYYVSSGYIDYHLLKWCFNYLKNKDVRNISEHAFHFFPIDIYERYNIPSDTLQKILRYEGDITLKEWMVKWGLAAEHHSVFEWTERGHELLAFAGITDTGVFTDCLRQVVDKITAEIETNQSDDTRFQKEIHYYGRFRPEFKNACGILRFSHKDFKIKNQYVIYHNINVKEYLSPHLKMSEAGLRDKDNNTEIRQRFSMIQSVSRILMQVEFKRIYIDNIIPNYEKSFLLNSIRAAISQVMARNESHNIGSHILSRLVTGISIQALRAEIKDLYHRANQYQPIPGLAQNKPNTPDKAKKKPNSYDFHESIAYLYSYLKTRMDFLADIATSTPTLQNSRLLLQEVMAGFDKNRIYLNRISGIDNFKLRFIVRDCRNQTEGQQSDDGPEVTNATDISVAIVNDILGLHAFYTILENIIRNTAKHADIGTDREVIFTIAISECEEDESLYTCLIYDNCPLSDIRIKKLVKAQNSRLNESILNEQNVLRKGNWGLIEMDVCAAYLRKINIEQIDAPRYDIPLNRQEEQKFAKSKGREKSLILKAVKKENHLAYQIHLPKPREILIIDPQGDMWKNRFYQDGVLDINALKELVCNGILCLHCMDKPALAAWKWQPATSYPQQLMLLLTPANYVQTSYIPQRVMLYAELAAPCGAYDSEDLWELMYKDKGRAFILEAWRCLVNNKMDEKGITQFNPQDFYAKFVTSKAEKQEPLNVTLDDHEKNIKTTLKSSDYYEGYNHLTEDLVNKIFTPDKLGTKELFSFMDSVLTNVLIIDERVQQHYSTDHPRIGMTVGAIASKSFIYCPERDTIDLNRQSLDKHVRGKLAEYLEKVSEQSKLKGLDIVVIHLGIIEKILKAEGGQKNKEDISRFIIDIKEQAGNPFVIITSGRGKPENLPDDVPFIGYSILSQFAIENRFKSLLVQALYAARPKT